MNNLADDPVHAPKMRELHSNLTSLVDPEVINEAAFRKQRQVQMAMVKKKRLRNSYMR